MATPCASQRDRALGDFGLRERAAPGDLFDRVAIQVAGGEIHRREDARRILAQHLVDHAHRLDEFAPVGRSQDAEAADAVADRDLVGGLPLAFRLHEPFDRLTFFREALLDPGEREGQRRALTLQPPRQLRDERTRRGRLGSRHVREYEDQASRIFFRDLGQPVCPVIRDVAVALVGGDADGDAPQVLDQRQAEHDRDRPQLAQRERSDGLVGGHEAAESRHVHAPVDVRDQLEHDVITARVSRRWPVQEPGQLPAVRLGQVPPGRSNLLLDQIEIVEEPLAGRSDPSFCHDGRRDELVRLHQNGLVFVEPRQEPVRASLSDQPDATPRCALACSSS